MQEWKDPYNSFNSAKGLTYFDNYKEIDRWRLGKRKAPPPPIEVSFDLFAACQLRCAHCNFGKYFEKKDTMNKKMPDEHVLNLVKFFGNWKEDKFRVCGICWGGGGESTLHTKLPDALKLSKQLGMDNSIATNGINLTDDLLDIIPYTCKWVGISVDASNEITYCVGRKGNYFNKVIENMKRLVRRIKDINSNCSIAYKMLLFNYNQTEIYNACKLAKEIGVRDFHCRPADFGHQGMNNRYVANPYDVNLIKEQFEKCHKIATEDFRIFTVVHKFNRDFTPRRKFKQCWASPICIQISPTGNIFLCPDTREMEFYKLGNHYPNPEEILEIWGSKKHYDLVFKSGFKNCYSRCTFTHYNEQCERLAVNKDDPMDLAFV